MPLKPIYGKTPLTQLDALMLRPGQVRMDNDRLRELYALTACGASHPALWEPAFRLAAILTDKPLQEPVAGWISQALAAQEESGALPMPLMEALQVMRAAWAMYEAVPERALLERMMRWCGWLSVNWEEAEACAELRVHPADLMELACNLYRVTGRKGLTALCKRIRWASMDWSGILHTFAVQRPMKRLISRADLDEGMAAEEGSESGFYTRQYLTCHGETLADGARASLMSACYSGNGPEASAARAGWEKISRWHGAVCGGVTADETLGGASPPQGVDAAALGAWAEVFASQLMFGKDTAWAIAALEALVENGLPAAVHGGKLIPFQRVNSLRINCGTADCYKVQEGEEQSLRALTRLTRGWAAAAGAAMMLCPSGVNVNLYLPGTYTVKLAEQPVAWTLSGADGIYTLTVRAKTPVKAALSLMIPAWAEDACIRVNDEGADAGQPGQRLMLNRLWRDGDQVQLSFTRALRVREGYHQGAAILYGAKVMAYVPMADDWAVALCGVPVLKDGKVLAAVAHVPGWKAEGNVPEDLPVRPTVIGEPFEAELVPYASTPCRVALFPRSVQA